MKIAKRLVLLYIIALLISSSLLFINSNVVVSNWHTRVYEVLTVSLPVFLVILVIYTIIRAISKTAKGIKNKKPSDREGL